MFSDPTGYPLFISDLVFVLVCSPMQALQPSLPLQDPKHLNTHVLDLFWTRHYKVYDMSSFRVANSIHAYSLIYYHFMMIAMQAWI